jgi:Tol biopolymer transport system component
MINTVAEMMTGRTVLLFLLSALGLLCACGGEDQPGAVSLEAPEGAPQFKAQVTFPGRIVFQSDLDGDSEIFLLTSGELKQLTHNTWEDRYPRWSPDGRKIACSANPRGNFDIFIMDDQGGNVTAVTDSPEDEVDVAWVPGQESLVYSERRKRAFGSRFTIWMIDPGSKVKNKAIPDFNESNQLPDVSPRDPWLAFTGKRTFGWDAVLYDWREQKIRDLTTGGNSCRPRFSSDGQKIAYVSSEADGKGDIWMVNADGSGRQRVTRRDDAYDYFPSWSPDGDQIVFCSNYKDHYADKGEWDLYLVNLSDQTVTLLFASPGKDVFPDWQRRIVPKWIGEPVGRPRLPTWIVESLSGPRPFR